MTCQDPRSVGKTQLCITSGPKVNPTTDAQPSDAASGDSSEGCPAPGHWEGAGGDSQGEKGVSVSEPRGGRKEKRKSQKQKILNPFS